MQTNTAHIMDIKKYITSLGFVPKDGTSGIYHKVYVSNSIEIDFNQLHINYGDKIVAESKTTQNFIQPENFVVLECVDRLLQKGYAPQNIVLEKTWPSGHGTSGRLDICINRDDGTPYLLIECKTYGKEFSKELSNINKDGGQLFTYFQLSGCKADVMMLYASELKGNDIVYVNKIIKVEDDYRSGDVKDIYEKWNKLTKDDGIFDSWVVPYNFQSKALTKEQLKVIKAEDSSFIFNRFSEILRHNVVSDKGNAFNKIFTLFLCKVYDETTTKDGEELKFQWFEGRDNNVDFQLRLTDLYSKGMKKFLDRTVSDFNDEDFEKRCANLNEDTKQYLRLEVNKLRLEKNNEFAIKEVYDNASFEENAKVVKEVVELIQGYRIRYNRRQQYLSDFFELLLTTGLKQESGQFFTPVPVAQFIIKSLPLDTIVSDKLSREDGEILPYMIDYAAGSGHFITEYMHEVQDMLNNCDNSKYIDETKTSIDTWKKDHFRWATKYVYGIEKDYRLVKVGKVGCYLHGDGLANVILSDGLANFCKDKDYKGKLHKDTDDGQKDNQQFDVLLSNPPYSVSSFRQTTRDYYNENDFDLYNYLTDNSSEIECLFVERTKQLVKDGGVCGIILPSSMLSNTGIYSRTRELILQFFEIVAIAELGSNTFMATNTNTVVLFLRRRNNYFASNTKIAIDNYLHTLTDVTINGIETPVAKYVDHVWEGLDYSDYVSLLQKTPDDKVKAHDIFAEYKNNITEKSEEKFWDSVLAVEAEKLLYFILAYPQQVVIVKSGEKDDEKCFLGYEFSNRRGNEGIHAIQRGKTIEECTQLFDAEKYDNPDKASTYIYKAFNGDYTSEIAESMKSHISRLPLVDMLTFDRSGFEKILSTTAKKKVTSNWAFQALGNICNLYQPKTITKQNIKSDGKYKVYGANGQIGFYDKYNHEESEIALTCRGATCGCVNYTEPKSWITGNAMIISPKTSIINKKFLFYMLSGLDLSEVVTGTAQPQITRTKLAPYRIPLPPEDIQKTIVDEIEIIEKNIGISQKIIDEKEKKIEDILDSVQGTMISLNTSVPFVTTSVSFDDISIETYVTTDNMLQNKLGIVSFDGVANISSVTKYEKDDILISNIRPYLKKIWLADKDGGCSKDVLVFRSSDKTRYVSKYIYYMLRRDAFFNYVMEGKKGVKMPRGNKDEIIKYKIPMPSPEEQQRIVVTIENLEQEIDKAQNMINKASGQKQAVLDNIFIR